LSFGFISECFEVLKGNHELRARAQSIRMGQGGPRSYLSVKSDSNSRPPAAQTSFT